MGGVDIHISLLENACQYRASRSEHIPFVSPLRTEVYSNKLQAVYTWLHFLQHIQLLPYRLIHRMLRLSKFYVSLGTAVKPVRIVVYSFLST